MIHTVGPVYRSANPSTERLLKNVYQRSLEVALSKGVRSVAFPAISTGVYGYPLEEAAPVALRTVIQFGRVHPEIERVCFVLHTSKAFRVFEEALKRLTSQGS